MPWGQPFKRHKGPGVHTLLKGDQVRTIMVEYIHLMSIRL